jgi:dipeptidyl aminopeptidase/acylaminoacyl peptidase
VESRSMTLLQFIVFTIACVMTSAFLESEEKQPMTPEACTSMRYLASDVTSLAPLQMSPDGTKVAYVLQVPDLQTNANKETLYVSAVNATSSSPPVSVLTDQLITASHWFPDNKTLAMMTRRDGKIVLEKIDSATKQEALIWAADGDITDYSMNATGDVIAIGVRANTHILSIGRDQRDESKGYRLDSESTDHSDSPRRNVYILRLVGGDRWILAQRVDFTSPLTGKMINDFDDNHASHISLSPNGRYLLIDDFESFSNIQPRAAWEHSPLVHYMRTSGFKGPVISYLYDIPTGSATIPLDSPFVISGLWAPDSKSFIKVAAAPAGSKWEASDFRNGTASNHDTHLFAVDVATGAISEVLHRAESAPLSWRMDGDLVVRNSSDALATLKEEGGIWRQLSTKRIPFPDTAPYSAISSDGDHVVMQYENTRTAPRLVAFELSSLRTWTVSNFNPQADDLIRPQSETISWTTPSGFTAKGMLLLPPNYDPHIRYPLVIEDGSFLYYGEFVCDSGSEHVSSFARGILADAGVVYFMRFWPGNNTWENTYYSKKYPGQLAEAAFKQELVESAAEMLTQRGIIDPAKIGLIGFSRGGWYVEHALMHSSIHFQAATVSDSFVYSMGDYWYWHNQRLVSTSEAMYGGPPYGSTLKNWLDYSISFNLDKIHTPLMLEVMGYGQKDDNPDRPPDHLAVAQEIFVGLQRLHKPVELYYYPDEQHQPDHPQARIASLQRNVDWFLFWLRGYERPNPEDPDQYVHWRMLRSKELPERGDLTTGATKAVPN